MFVFSLFDERQRVYEGHFEKFYTLDRHIKVRVVTFKRFIIINYSKPIILLTNFMTLIPSLTLTELWVVSMEHSQRVWHASRERLPFKTPGSVPFWDKLMLRLLRSFSRTCRVFSRLFALILIDSFWILLCKTWKATAMIWAAVLT